MSSISSFRGGGSPARTLRNWNIEGSRENPAVARCTCRDRVINEEIWRKKG